MAGDQRKSLSLVHRVRRPGVAPRPGARPPLLVLLHGLGSNELAMAALAGAFDRRFVVLSVRAPIELEPFAFAWLHETWGTAGLVLDPDEASAASHAVERFVDEAIPAYAADPDQVFLVGFSQGGMVSLAAMLVAPERVAGVVSMSGRLPAEMEAQAVSAGRLRAKQVLVVHGSRDATIEVREARDAVERLRAIGLAAEYREFDMAHATTEDSLAAVGAWLAARISP